MNVEKWFRWSLIVTFFMNMAGALVFTPPVRTLREFGGLPEAGHPLYGWLIAIWIFLFGLCYLQLAFSKSPERLFVAIGAAGKSSFALLLIALSLAGELPFRSALVGLGDLFIALIFALWLYQTRSPLNHR